MHTQTYSPSSNSHTVIIAKKLDLKQNQIHAVEELLDAGSTVPFIARYRKEQTGSLDEVSITDIKNELLTLKEFQQRKQSILSSLEKSGKLTDSLKKQVLSAENKQILEDIYLPHKQKRKTKAEEARKKGLEPLAKRILKQDHSDPYTEAKHFVNPEKKVTSPNDAIDGALDILAETMNEHAFLRSKMRRLFQTQSIISCKSSKKENSAKYSNYFDHESKAVRTPSHRILAMMRGEKEGCLKVSVRPPEDRALAILQNIFIKQTNKKSKLILQAASDSYKRLISGSMETETRKLLKEKADDDAISVFTKNLEQLLLAPPYGEKRIMGIDPGFRTGCKMVCLDKTGTLLKFETLFPFEKSNKTGKLITTYCQKYHIESIAIGNGTAGRETETFIRTLNLPDTIETIMVNENGASIYSASEVAREEFPDLDITYRGAVSIGRRLMDPLSELVKIDPAALGIGQYQHDVDKKKLSTALQDVVTSCVNRVGVDLNTASKELLTYVSGIGPKLAQNIITHRQENGPFKNRNQLKKVSGLGAKTFEQAAGFLKIPNGNHPLDSSSVHPESYRIVEKMAKNLGIDIKALIQNKQIQKQIIPEDYITDKTGLPTLLDILKELDKPGRDPREPFADFHFKEGINSIKDVKKGMTLPAVITNITAFGAFADLGVHQDGLIHISEISDTFIKSPSDVLSLQQHVTVVVLDVDYERNRISLSMKQNTQS